MAQERIKLDDTMLDIFIKMSEGNPGATSVMTQLVKYGLVIDGYSGGIMDIMHLDAKGIYGSQIWVLYKDVCKESLVNLVALLRYYQLGLMPDDNLFDECRDFVAVRAAVKERLPKFNVEVSHGLYN
jgi:hypothetical protein